MSRYKRKGGAALRSCFPWHTGVETEGRERINTLVISVLREKKMSSNTQFSNLTPEYPSLLLFS